jgi:hypothetical protein
LAKKDKRKGPKTLIDPAVQKVPRTEYHEDWQRMRPAWRISLVQMVTPFGWEEIDAATIERIRTRLAAFESMTWKEILTAGQGGYRHHLIAISRLCRRAQERLVILQQDDVDSLVSLGITQRERVFGILEHNVLKVLWWDPDHEVCPVEMPNT